MTTENNMAEKTIAEMLDQTTGDTVYAPLSERLKTVADAVRSQRPEFTAAVDRMVARLEANQVGQNAPGIGEPMPDFILPNQDGKLVRLGELTERGPVVVSFNRGHWCPYCKLDLRALAQSEPEIRRLGAQLVSIMPEKAQYTKRAIADNDVPFPILTDIDLSYALSLGLVFWIGSDMKKLYSDLGLDLAVFQGNRSYFLPIASKFVVGRDGLVKAREINLNFRERMEPTAIIAALENL